VTADYYSILGVTPAAEDVVIRAAYRALIRHYHPDTNTDPEAQERARAITAAFAVLRDPAKRAEYDARRTAGQAWWIADELRMPPDQRPPPSMRGLGIASAAIALALVVTVSVWPQPDPPRGHAKIVPAARQTTARSQPPVELEPEVTRLARLHGDSADVEPPPEGLTDVAETAPIEPLIALIDPVPTESAEPVRVAMANPRRSATRAFASTATLPRRTKANIAPPEASDGCRPGGSVVVSVGCKNPQIAALDRMAAGFFSQSMAHADAARKQLLLSSHTRSAAARGSCRSDSCVTDAYLRQMREISTIMKSGTGSAE
jgi:hypothetical protein